jgi:hypothetical protein
MNAQLSNLGGRCHARRYDGMWWVSLGGHVASAPTLAEAFARAMAASRL